MISCAAKTLWGTCGLLTQCGTWVGMHSRKARHWLCVASTVWADLLISRGLTEFETPICVLSWQIRVSQSSSIIGCNGDCDHRTQSLVTAFTATKMISQRVVVCIDRLVTVRGVEALRKLDKCCRMSRAARRQVRARCTCWLMLANSFLLPTNTYSSMVTVQENGNKGAIK